jgi:hypothetical protein
MGGRGTYAIGNNVAFTYKTIDSLNGVKILQGLGFKHDLPIESHSSSAYIKLYSDGAFSMFRVYNKQHYLTTEIAFHPEPKLTGNHDSVLHIHHYDKNLHRTQAAYLDKTTYMKYKKFLKGMKWYDKR